MNDAQAQEFDRVVDTLVVGSGAGGMTAALASKSRGLETLLIEKASRFGGSSALSGGGLWIPGAPPQMREGHEIDLDEVFEYLKLLTEGLVSDERLRAYVDEGPKMMRFLEELSPQMQFIWKAGYPDYYPELRGGSTAGSVINVPAIDLRELGADIDALLPPLALAPRGMWIGPSELREFYRLRQSWKAKALFVKLVWRMVRARLTGERIVTVGQSLMARLWLTARQHELEIWLESPMISLITETDGRVIGARVVRHGEELRVGARGGVILATGGFDHDAELRRLHQPFAEKEYSLGARTNTGDGIRAGVEAGAATTLMEEAWWYPAVAWPTGGVQFSLNERMMPSQFIVNGDGERYINEAAPYSEFGQAMIRGQAGSTPHIPSWLITDMDSWHKYVIFGHLPVPKIPLAPVPTGWKIPKAWLKSGVVFTGDTWQDIANQIGVPATNLAETARRYNEIARTGADTDFHRGASAYDHYYGDVTLPNPNLAPLGNGPYIAFRLILADLGTNGGVNTDEAARVLRADGSPITGLYATGNTSAAVMGRSYAGAGATLGPAMTFGYIAAQDIAKRTSARGAHAPQPATAVAGEE
ncbi:FAD-binding protein [Arthrobacter sp. D1-29]